MFTHNPGILAAALGAVKRGDGWTGDPPVNIGLEFAMAKVLGVGGVFFKSDNPEKLAAWYAAWLGVPALRTSAATFNPAGMPPGGFTVWASFARETAYFAPSDKDYMINLVVDDLDGALDQVVKGGATVVGEIAEFDYGRFGWFLDPDGNKVELWQPRAT